MTGENFWARFRRWYGMQPRGLRTLVAINVVAYVLWLLVLRHFAPVAEFVWAHVVLNAGGLRALLEPWQLVTYNFLHLDTTFFGFLHLLFNMLWLHWIGREFEEMNGSHRLVSVYLLSGIGGGLLTVLVYALVPQLSAAYVYGASASVLGVLAAVATLYPHQSIGLLFIGVVPLRWLVVGFLVLDLLFGFRQGHAVMAHFGGALAGFLIARAERSGRDLSGWATVFFRRRAGRSRGRGAESRVRPLKTGWMGPRKPAAPAAPAAAAAPSETVVLVDPEQQEVDRILDKISARGYDSLTDEEKRVLYEASRK